MNDPNVRQFVTELLRRLEADMTLLDRFKALPDTVQSMVWACLMEACRWREGRDAAGNLKDLRLVAMNAAVNQAAEVLEEHDLAPEKYP